MPKLTKAHKKAISEGQKRRHERTRELLGDYVPECKKCTKCGEVKPIDQYVFKKRALASGEIKRYPAGECRTCANKRAAAWREQKRKEGVLDELQREWNKNRDPEKKRKYNREYGAMRRREQGAAVRGPWKRYRKREPEYFVDVKPFSEWLRKHYAKQGGIRGFARKLSVNEARLRTFMRGTFFKNGREYPVRTVSLEFVDRALLAHDGTEHLWDLYPEFYS